MEKENTDTFSLVKKRVGSRTVAEVVCLIHPHGLEAEPIKLKISLKPKDWLALGKYWDKNKDAFEYDLAWIMALVREKLKPRPRGKNKDLAGLIESIKSEAAWLYLILSYWCSKPKEARPKYIVDILAMADSEAKSEDYEGCFRNSSAANSSHSQKRIADGKQKNEYNVKLVTAYCIQKIYGKEVKSQLDPFFSFDPDYGISNFYITYIGSRGIKRLQKAFIEKRTEEEIRNLPQKHSALRTILGALQGLVKN
ncbi:MAG: hypothetical protein A4E58_02108 [Syntrophorhabdus sp. PtaB.Bin006]|nr:MAG: hypothetical protein A4E58_02108 [Syntrophorhabdus sp. PtaB.Bin006]